MYWKDHPRNPLVGPRWWSWLAGDPCVLSPEATPDGHWWMFANEVTGIYARRSADGIRWHLAGRLSTLGNRPWVLPHEGRWYLYYQDFRRLWTRSRIVCRTSEDLRHWSRPRTVLHPDLPWEGHDLSNACVFPRDGAFWMYYSANAVFLRDMGFSEPSHVSLARAAHPLGPWKKLGEPVLAPEPGHRFRERGAGALKVYPDLLPGWLVGFENGIYRDDRGRSGSAILLLRSRDGLRWEDHPENPILSPSGGEPRWRRAHVYQLDVVPVGDALWMYYNARSGWRFGVERIGLAVLEDRARLWEG